MTKILVALDIARPGGNDAVLDTAETLAGAMGAGISVIYVLDPPPSYVLAELPEAVLGKRQAEAEDMLREILEGRECDEIVVREGPPAMEILDHAASIDADLIVLHSHEPGFSDYFIGSVAGRVVRHAHCSVYVLRGTDGEG